MNSALSAFMVSRKSSGQMEMRSRVQERGQLQPKGARRSHRQDELAQGDAAA